MRYRSWIVSLALGILPAAFGQTQPSFEVASIKPAPSMEELVRSRSMHIGVKVNGAQVDFGYSSPADLIRYAFRVEQFQISGPKDLSAARYDILGKIPAGATPNQAPEMVQHLLAERFHLAYHMENKEFPA